MGFKHTDRLRDSVGKTKTFHEENFESLPTYDNYYVAHEGFDIQLGKGAEIKLKLPPGNYELDAIVRLFNNSSNIVFFSCALEYFMDEVMHDLWEGGQMESTGNSAPHLVHFKAMTTFKKTKTIKFRFGVNASSELIAFKPCILAKRTGSIKHTTG